VIIIPPACFGEVNIPPAAKEVFFGGLFEAGEGVTGVEMNVYYYG
jgi:hypothetical protein